MTTPRLRQRKRGGAMVEFVLAASLFLVPLLLGTMSVGFNLLRSTEVSQFTRDAAHMYAEGVDFAQSSNQQIIVSLASGLNFSLNGGTGVIIFSTLLLVGPTDCVAGGFQANTSSCPNLGQVVVTRRLVIGNSSVYATTFGTPNSLDPKTGNVPPSTYLTSTSDRATGFAALLTLTPSSIAYLTETYFSSADYNITGLISGSGVYARGIF